MRAAWASGRRLLPVLVALSRGAGLDWLGINGGFSEDYRDSQGRLWHHTKDAWTPSTWGGWLGSEPRDYTNAWGSVRMKCKNWPPEYDQDYEALLHHYSIEAGTNQTFRVNLQDPKEPMSYYTVKYNFCEKQWHGGGKMDLMINGKVVKKDYTTKCHHTRTDIYHFKCVPTMAGMIEVTIQGDPEVKGGQARFSTLEFEKSSEGCTACESISCGKGFCSSSSFYDYSSKCDFGNEEMENEYALEEVQTTTPACACDPNVQGEACELGPCAAVACNEPMGGSCVDGQCHCIEGHTGTNCEVPPDVDQFGCYARHEEVSDFMTVSTVCLPELIAGPARNGHIFRGPSPMNAVADKMRPETVYFSWTADTEYGKPGAAGSEGRVYVSKLKVPWKEAAVLEENLAFSGFVRAGGIDITEDGVVGTLCAKYWHPWVENTGSSVSNAAMVLAVCEVNGTTMMQHRLPWQIGKQYQAEATAPNTGIWGSFPLSAWFAQRSAGYGYLVYSPAHQLWTAWYGATVGSHTGFAMHTYHKDAPTVSDEEYTEYTYPVPRDQVEPRQEATGPWKDHHRTGTGDHQASAAMRYHPRLKDIGLQKHTHGPVYMQQYGLAQDGSGQPPAGAFAPPGHKTGRLELVVGNETGLQANALRPCGEDWLVAIIADTGNVCAKVTKLGEVALWRVIEASVGKMPCGSNGGNCGDQAPGRMLRLANLGTPEHEASARCGPDERFLLGFEKEDRSRWLVELDGDCNEVSDRMDVTQHTHWPLYQDWTTTAQGAVVWVSSWHTDPDGDFGPPGSPNGVWPYNPKPQSEEAEHLFGLTPGAMNAAKVTVYYPRHLPSTSATTTRAATTTTIAATTSSVTSTTTPGIQGFHGEGNGSDQACRGAHANDNRADYYSVVPAASLEVCQRACMAEPLCSGVEYSEGRCEVWTRVGGIRATRALANFRCLRYEPPGASALQPQDGAGGVDRVCRGTSATDNSPSYMTEMEADSLFECKALCLKDPECKGIEFGPHLRRCEVWNRYPSHTQMVSGFVCLARAPESFQPLLGDGSDQACRGAHGNDNSQTYYTVLPEPSLDACIWSCLANDDCKGVEFSRGRCEVWTRAEGIQATISLKGFTCLRRPTAPALASLGSRKSRHQRFLGPAFLQAKLQSHLRPRLEL